MRSGTVRARDRSLQRLSRINRWLLSGSVALTAVLTEVTAHAFPGKAKARSNSETRAVAAKRRRATSAHRNRMTPKRLQPPAQAPQAATPPPPPPQESAPPTHEEAPPEPEIAPERTPEPEAQAPVVSGGS